MVAHRSPCDKKRIELVADADRRTMSASAAIQTRQEIRGRRVAMIRYLLCLAILASASWAVAADDAKQSPDEVAIRKAIDSYIDAFNKGDAAAVANHFSETGAYIDPISGEREVGREAIAKSLTERFALGLKPKLSVNVDSVRLLDDNVAIEEGTATIVTKKTGPEVSTYVAIHVKKDGKWQLDSVRELSCPSPTRTRRARSTS